jgi:hypothetical protein
VVTPYHADTREIGMFVAALFRYAESDTYISLRAFDQFDGRAPPRITPSRVNGSIDALVRDATIAAENAAQSDVPLVFCPPLATFTNAAHAAVKDLANGLSLSVEIDDGDPDEARLRLEAILGPVTVVVRSGSTWTDPATGEIKPRVHLHWRLNEPTRCADDHERLRHARGLACLLAGADPTANAVVHPMRWPGSWNFKLADRPRMAVIAVLNEAAEIDLSDALDALEAAVEAAGLAKAAEMPAASSTPEARLADVRSAMLAIPNPGRGEGDEVNYKDWVRLGIAVRRATGGGPEGFSIWHDWSALSDKYVFEETVATWRRIVASTAGPPPPRTAGAGTIFFLADKAGWVRPFPFDSTRNGAAHDSDGATSVPLIPLILTMRQLDALPPPEWLVHGLLPEKSLVVAFGPPKAFKSFVALSLALHIADDKPWFGHTVRQGVAVYIAGEGTGGLSTRLRAMRTAYDINIDAPLFVIRKAVNFRDHAAVQALAKLIRETVGEGVPIRMVVIDTLARAMPGADENSAQEVGLVIAECDWLKDDLDTTVMLVHHSGKDESKGARGTSALRGAWDAAFEIRSAGKRRAMMTVVDQKEAEAGQQFVFRMDEIAVGLGRTSLVPMLDETPETPGADDRRQEPTGLTKIALDVLRNLIAGPEGGILPPLSGMPTNDTRGAPHESWRREFYQKMPGETVARKRLAFWRASQKLEQLHFICMREPWVWLI